MSKIADKRNSRWNESPKIGIEAMMAMIDNEEELIKAVKEEKLKERAVNIVD